MGLVGEKEKLDLATKETNVDLEPTNPFFDFVGNSVAFAGNSVAFAGKSLAFVGRNSFAFVGFVGNMFQAKPKKMEKKKLTTVTKKVKRDYRLLYLPIMSVESSVTSQSVEEAPADDEVANYPLKPWFNGVIRPAVKPVVEVVDVAKKHFYKEG